MPTAMVMSIDAKATVFRTINFVEDERMLKKPSLQREPDCEPTMQ